MPINSSELRAAGFTLREVIPSALEVAARSVRRKYWAGMRQLHGMGHKRLLLSTDNDNKFRSRCKWIREIFLTQSRKNNFLSGEKGPFPWRVPASGLGDKYLSAVVLAHHDPALSQFQNHWCDFQIYYRRSIWTTKSLIQRFSQFVSTIILTIIFWLCLIHAFWDSKSLSFLTSTNFPCQIFLSSDWRVW